MVIEMLEYIGLGLAALMFAINGIKMMVSDSPMARADARRGIIYVVIGIIILVLSYAIVSFLLAGDLVCI
jgi:hypothetical protein